MIAHRLTRGAFAALDGEGARLFGGRWNPKGMPVVYAASTLSLAALEALVHFDSDLWPADSVAVTIDIPTDLMVLTMSAPTLPARWRDDPAPSDLQDIGRLWVQTATAPVMRVPSAVIPSEWNVLINPAHPEAARITIGAVDPFSLDPRLLPRR